jgi:hypothetical protein
MPLVFPLNFLKKEQVTPALSKCETQIVDTCAESNRPRCAHDPLMDVVGHNAKLHPPGPNTRLLPPQQAVLA